MNDQRLILHCGGVPATFEDIDRVEVPDETESYIPVSHGDLARNIMDVSKQILMPKGYTFLDSSFGLAGKGQRMFGVMRYKNGGDELAMAIGLRNSYDKSMSCGICFGASVFICDNLAFHGDITIMRKHTGDVKSRLVDDLIMAMHRSTAEFLEVQKLAEHLKQIGLNDDQGYKLLGLLHGRGVMTPTIVNEAMRQWKDSEFEVFQPRNAWSLYNACTFALKATPPNRVLEAHVELSHIFEIEFT